MPSGYWIRRIGQDQSLIFLAGLADGKVGSSLTLKLQAITIPETEWSGDRGRFMRDVYAQRSHETLVQTFCVDESCRQTRIGRALQVRALEVTKEAGCIQMRSWSSPDKKANYQLKLSLGFGFHPEVQQTPSGLKISGGYFIKSV